MRTVQRLLLLLCVLLVLSAFGHAQVRELGTGAPGPVKAHHLTAELISDSETIAPGGQESSRSSADA
jgi:thiol:disulfide interchange protein DsbD